ncbi:hypothetical protein PO909_031698 [Leuciscus waleckii]
MSSAGMFQTQISAIMKAAAVEISQLLEEEAAALHQEIRRRNQEIQGLKTKLLRVTAERCSVGVQVEIMDTSSFSLDNGDKGICQNPFVKSSALPNRSSSSSTWGIG